MNKSNYHIGIEIDRLTNSIVNTISGDSFQTEILPATKEDLKGVTKKGGWKFNWKAEVKLTDREVYKLTIEGNPNIVQDLLSISDYDDHIFMHLIESALLILGSRNYTKGFQVIWLRLLVRNRWKKAMKDSLLSSLSRN